MLSADSALVALSESDSTDPGAPTVQNRMARHDATAVGRRHLHESPFSEWFSVQGCVSLCTFVSKPSETLTARVGRRSPLSLPLGLVPRLGASGVARGRGADDEARWALREREPFI